MPTDAGFCAQRTILVIEDDPNDQFFILEAFRAAGCTNPIQFAKSGSEAIAYLMAEGRFADREAFPYPAFVTTDLKMAGGDGFAVLEHLLSMPDRRVASVVVLSASVDQDDINRAYLLGASSYHVKPLGFCELRRQVKVLHDYWMTFLVPRVDAGGSLLWTGCTGKLGEGAAGAEKGRRRGK